MELGQLQAIHLFHSLFVPVSIFIWKLSQTLESVVPNGKLGEHYNSTPLYTFMDDAFVGLNGLTFRLILFP